MKSKFERGDVIKERAFKRTMHCVVLDNIEPECIRVYSASGYAATILKDREYLYEKIGHINLRYLMLQIKNPED